jgi:hypothetical protein
VAEIRPDDALEGIVREAAVVLLAPPVAATPFSVKVVAPEVALKLVPVIVTLVPEAPIAGVKDAIVGAPATVMTKSVALWAETPPTVTAIRPVVAPEGTVVAIEPESDAITVAAVPLNVTVLFAGVALNPVP